jgi:hypothetical protein
VHIVAIAISITLCVTGYVYLLKSINEQLQIQHEICQETISSSPRCGGMGRGKDPDIYKEN